MHEKFIKRVIRSIWNQYKHCSKSFILPYHIWSLFATIHKKSWPNVKIYQIGVGSDIAQNHSTGPKKAIISVARAWAPGSHLWLLFTPLHMKGGPKSKINPVGVGSNIAQNLSEVKSGHFWPNSHKRLTKSNISSDVAQIHSSGLYSWAKVKLCQF